ncbi:MAG: hypothetical protein IJS54_01800 [Desulfovibrio sp.]|nr:hypothetical protein [Desulfovibrio sp.]
MRTTLIRTTPRATINALAYQGILPCEHFVQIFDTLLRHFGESHAFAFAEPVSNTHEGFIDWYVPFAGDVRPYAALDGAEKEAACAAFASIAKDIRDHAQSLIASNDPQKITRGNILLLALNYPHENDLFVVDGKPVVTCWGFAPGTEGAPLSNLCDLTLPKAPIQKEAIIPPVAPAPAPKKSFGFLPWLLPLFLLLLILFLLLANAEYLRIPFVNSDLLDKEAVLSSEYAKKEEARKHLEDAILLHMAQCRTRLPETAKHKDPLPSAAPVTKPDVLVIPDNVKDTSFLSGHWLCATGLINTKTQEPVQVEFLFDRKGKGLGRVYEKDNVCEGEAKALMAASILRIEHEPLVCQKGGGSYAPNTIQCEKHANGETACTGKSATGFSWDAVFVRIKD